MVLFHGKLENLLSVCRERDIYEHPDATGLVEVEERALDRLFTSIPTTGRSPAREKTKTKRFSRVPMQPTHTGADTHAHTRPSSRPTAPWVKGLPRATLDRNQSRPKKPKKLPRIRKAR